MIDVTITLVIWMVIEVLYGPLSTNMTLTLAIYVVGPLYYVIPMGLRGQTLGKVAIGIMVVNERGEPPGITKAIIRAAARIQKPIYSSCSISCSSLCFIKISA